MKAGKFSGVDIFMEEFLKAKKDQKLGVCKKHSESNGYFVTVSTR